ncbi:hypothetical protein ACHAXT_009497 [Thalassiosira profunda]
MRPPSALIVVALMTIRFRSVGAFVSTMKRAHDGLVSSGPRAHQTVMSAVANSTATSASTSAPTSIAADSPPLYLAEGLVAVHKPLTWSSNDVVSYIRGILTRDARDRGFVEDNNGGGGNNNNRKRGRRKKPLIKVGHGGTLDPLASGVLVLGIGRGTSMLQSYLEGDKQYIAACQLGYETDTLDAEGKLVQTAAWEHVTSLGDVEAVLPKFTGKIEQVPPLYSAIRVDGKRLYEIARKDSAKTEEVEIPKREVEVYGVQASATLEESALRSGVVDGPRYREAAAEKEAAADAEAAAKGDEEKVVAGEEGSEDESGGGKRKKRRRDKKKKPPKKSLFNESNVPSIPVSSPNLELPQFALSVQCGGGTYIRSLVRDIGCELNTVATMTGLVRTKQGPFVLEDALMREEWTAEKIYEAVRKGQEKVQQK